MIDLDAAAVDLARAPRPALFLDTCSLLDIVRAPSRGLSNEVAAAIDLRDLLANGRIHLVVQDIVHTEWSDNIQSARKDANKGIGVFEEVWQIAACLNQPGFAPPGPSAGPLVAELEQLSRDLLNGAVTLDQHPDCFKWASNRSIAKLKPSANGGYKDGLILGHALSLCDLLRIAGHSCLRMFVSSNRSDFTGPSSAHFDPAIEADANPVGLIYAASLTSAIGRLRGSRQI